MRGVVCLFSGEFYACLVLGCWGFFCLLTELLVLGFWLGLSFCWVFCMCVIYLSIIFNGSRRKPFYLFP